ITAVDASTLENESFFNYTVSIAPAHKGPTWYVNDNSTNNDVFTSTTGSDTEHTGGPNDPWLTISHAMKQVGPGDTVKADAGTYGETVEITADTLALVGVDSGVNGTVLDFGDSTATTAAKGIYADTEHDILIDSLRVMNSYDGIKFKNVDNLIIRNSTVKNHGNVGMWVLDSSSPRITGNITRSNSSVGLLFNTVSSGKIRSNVSRLNGGDGFELTKSDNNVVENNEAISENNNGIFVTNKSNNNLVKSNLVEGNLFTGIFVNASSDTNRFVYNTVSSNDDLGIDIYGSNHNRFHQNSILNNANWQIKFRNTSTADTIAKNNISPSSTNPDSGLYNPSANSHFIKRNYWNTTDEDSIAQIIDDSVNSFSPYRLGEVDTGVGADSIAPASPTSDTAVNLGSDTIEVRWTQVTQDEDGSALDFDRYRVYRTKSDTLTDWKSNATVVHTSTAGDATDTGYTDVGLNSGDTYYYRVTAVDASTPENESFFSDTMSAVPAHQGPTWYVNDNSTANDIFTSTTGSDTENTGGPNDPFNTITHAMKQVTSGDTVKADAGTYGETVTIDTNPFALVGADSSPSGTVLDYGDSSLGANAYGVNAVNESNLVIKNLKLANMYKGLELDNVDRSMIVNVRARHLGTDGISLINGSETSTIQNSLTRNSTDIGFTLSGSSSNNTLKGNLSKNDRNQGFYINSSRNTVSNNISKNCASEGFFVAGSDNVLKGNTSKSSGASGGIEINSGTNNVLKNNVSKNGAGAGFYLFSDNNRVVYNVSTGNDTGAIEIANAAYNYVASNRFHSNSGYEVRLTGTSFSDTVMRNNILPSSPNPDSGLTNTSGNSHKITRNYWGVTDEDTLEIRIDDTLSNFRPYRLGKVDTGVGADSIAPASPTSDTALSQSGQIEVRWDKVTQDEDGSLLDFTGGEYRVYRDTTGTVTDWKSNAQLIHTSVAGDASDTGYTDTDVNQTQTYYYRVTAVDNHTPENESFFSDTISTKLQLTMDTTTLKVADGSDTLGASQLNGSNNLGDTVSHTVTIEVQNADTVNLYYRRDGLQASFTDTKIQMSNTTADTYKATIPDTEITGGDTINFILEGIQNDGDTLIRDNGATGFEYWVWDYSGPLWFVNDNSTSGDAFTSKVGSDSAGNGSSIDPFRSVNKAVNEIVDGDTVKVDAGTFTPADSITIGASNVGLVGADSTSTQIDFNNTASGSGLAIFAQSQSQVRIKNLNVSRGYNGIQLSVVSGALVHSVRSDSHGQHGIFLESNSDTSTIHASLAVNNTNVGFRA
ncbi:MAG: right-handed parallel beta-helix repeat-containing protein, partial [bacterium]